jgi:UDP-glucose 4-epimerase
MPNILISGEHSFIGNSFKKISRYKDARFISLRGINPEAVDFSEIDVVIHLSAIVHSTKKIPSSEYFRVNRDLAIDFARRAKATGVRQFIFMSTIKVYGKYLPGSVWNETSKCKPDDYYGESKLEAENCLNELNDDSFTVSIIRTPLVYGPGNKANIEKLFKLVRFMPVLPFRDTDNLRHYDYIENLITLIDRVIEKNLPGIFISMDHSGVSTEKLVSYIANSLGKKVIMIKLPGIFRRIVKLFFQTDYERLFGSLIIDNSITRKRLNYTPLFSTREGIYRTLNENDLNRSE